MISARPQSEAAARVLFDDDYRKFILGILEKLERERAEVSDLRRMIIDLNARIAQLQARIL